MSYKMRAKYIVYVSKWVKDPDDPWELDETEKNIKKIFSVSSVEFDDSEVVDTEPDEHETEDYDLKNDR